MDPQSLFSVKDKVVLITGGSRGIGKMIAHGFTVSNAKVYISSRNAADLEQTANELNSLNKGRVISIPADLSKYSECERLKNEIEKNEKKLHVLINNSGATWGEDYQTYPDSAWDKVLTLNLKRVFTITQMLTPLLERAASQRDPSRIIHIGSIDGIRTPAMSTFAYSASKAGLHHLSRNLAHHLGQRNITSNTIACGAFESKMMKATLERFSDAIVAACPLGRIGSPEDVAGTAIFLASRAGAYVNGALITLDGGTVVAARI